MRSRRGAIANPHAKVFDSPAPRSPTSGHDLGNRILFNMFSIFYLWEHTQTWSCGISNRRGWRAEQNASKIFILGSNWWPWGVIKGQISLNSSYPVNFKDFISNFVCVLTNERYKTYQTGFYSVAWVMPQGWDFEALGVPRGSNFFFKHGHVA